MPTRPGVRRNNRVFTLNGQINSQLNPSCWLCHRRVSYDQRERESMCTHTETIKDTVKEIYDIKKKYFFVFQI